MKASAGFTLLEVLITLIVLAIGMLGLANLQSKIHVTEMESYQRAHAVLLLQDMVDRINTNRADAAAYVSADALGNETDEDCTAPATLMARDRCQWSDALLGASEKKGTANVGAMLNARGCVTLVQAEDAAAGVCQPGIYRVSVVWQGLHDTFEPENDCAAAAFAGMEKKRRVISTDITVGLPRCGSP
jgi:type IV pilus assembly protein PilV